MQGTSRSGVGGEKSLLCDPGSELRLGGRENRRGEDNKWDGKKKKRKRYRYVCYMHEQIPGVSALRVGL